MVTNTEANSYVSSVEWAEEGVQLKDFARKYKLPCVGRVIKGHYEGIGVPSLSCPSSRQTAFWLNGGQVIKVAAQCVKFKESRGFHGSIASRPVPFGPKLAIPDNYDGFFEILSEEGRSVRCIESVNELVKRSPSSVLIRESIKVYLPKGDNENIVSDKSRTLAIGEVLTLVNSESDNINNNHIKTNNNVNSNKSFSTSDPLPAGRTKSSSCDNQVNSNSDSSVSTSESTSSSESSSSSPSSPISSTCSSTTDSSSFGVKLSSPVAATTHCQPGPIITTTSASSQAKYLKGYTGKGEIVYLPIEGKGRFSPIAKEDSISGVHRISSLLTKRLPLMVRLVFGRPPAGFKSFTPEMRLFSIFSEDYLMALPVTKESAPVVTVPLSASLKIVAPKNGSSLSTHRYHDILISRFNEKTSGSPNSLLPNRIQVCEGSSLGKRLKSNWKESNLSSTGELNSDPATVTSESVNYSHKKRLFQSDSLDFVNNNVNNSNNESDNVKNLDSESTELIGIDDESSNPLNGETNESEELNVEEDETDDNDGSCYDEIDQIYDYVRGFAPLPEKLRPVRTSNPDSPPEPPPIETIPSLVTHQHHHGNSHHPSYPSHHHSSYRRLSYPTVFHEILPKMGLYEKKVSPSEHIYEKVPLSSGHHRPEKRYHSGNIRSREMSYHHQQSASSHNHGPRIPMRSNSTGKMYLPLNGLPVHPHPGHLSSSNHHSSTQLHQLHPLHQHNNPPHHHHGPLAKPKLFIKSNHQPSAGPFTNGSNGNSNNNRKTNKLMRNARGLSLGNENSAPYYSNNNNNNENDKDLIFNNNNINNNYHGIKANEINNKWTCRSSRSLTTSPLFNIRYKSLTNLHFINPLANSSSSKGCYDHHSNNTLASSNSSGCKISSGSGRSVESPSDIKAKKTRKLSRPLSFSNLFWDLKNDLISSSHHNNNNTIDSIYPDPRISSSPNGGEPSAMVLTQLVNNVASNRRVGTLYL